MAHASDKTKKPRRFLPEPVETISRSSKDRRSEDKGDPPTISRRMRSDACTEQDTTQSIFPAPRLGTNQPYRGDISKQQRPRKFAPQLMETARHSFRRERKPFLSVSEEGHLRGFTHANNLGGISLSSSAHLTNESRFSYTSILRRQEARRHSFRVPDLPAIPSSCSEGSNDMETSSYSRLAPTTDAPPIYPSCGKMGESVYGTQFPEYIATFPTHSPESQLKEQALAAFPNEQVYQPVDHFAIDREEDDCSDFNGFTYMEQSKFHKGKLGPRAYRRASSADLPWELEYLRRHKEEAGTSNRHAPVNKESLFSYIPHRTIDKSGHSNDGWDRDRNSRLRHKSRPPMLGADLIFPQSLTPRATICEGADLTEQHNEFQQSFIGFPGLWGANPHPLDKQSGGGGGGGGLWMGTCRMNLQRRASDEPLLPGILTPIHVVDGNSCRVLSERPTTKAQNQSNDPNSPSQDINHKEDVAHEFDDEFVTQIYNYLSLGYPSVARYYDYELSKVSGVSVATLREDDLNTDAMGHVGVQDTTRDKSTGKAVCMRWVALRLYIHEWARQRPQMIEGDSNHGAWGVRERKGSWAI